MLKSFPNWYFQVGFCHLLLDNFEEKIHFRFLLDKSFLYPTFFSANIISLPQEFWKPFQLNQHKLAPLVRVEVFLQVWSHLRSRNLNFHPTKARASLVWCSCNHRFWKTLILLPQIWRKVSFEPLEFRQKSLLQFYGAYLKICTYSFEILPRPLKSNFEDYPQANLKTLHPTLQCPG